MKITTSLLWLLATSAGLLVGCKQGVETPVKYAEHHRYPMERAHVHYLYSGLGRGEEDLYFDQFGKREAKLAHWEHIEDDKFHPYNSMTLTLGGDIYAFSQDRDAGTHWRDASLDSQYHMTKPDSLPAEVSSRNFIQSMADFVGRDTVVGMPTEIWHPKGSPIRLHVWRGVLLARETVMTGDSVVMTAISVDTTHAIDERVFTIPKGMKIEDRPAPGKPPGQ